MRMTVAMPVTVAMPRGARLAAAMPAVAATRGLRWALLGVAEVVMGGGGHL